MNVYVGPGRTEILAGADSWTVSGILDKPPLSTPGAKHTSSSSLWKSIACMEVLYFIGKMICFSRALLPGTSFVGVT